MVKKIKKNIQPNNEKNISKTVFLVLKNNGNQNEVLTIYNTDNSIWKTFTFNNKFNDDSINPYAINPEIGLLIFKYLGKENQYYKIVIDEDKKIIKYIKESDPNFTYQTIQQHILTVFSVEFNEEENPLRLEPDESSKKIQSNKDSFYYPIKINGKWLMVEDDNKERYWVQWCDSKENLILELFYDA